MCDGDEVGEKMWCKVM